jgi:hypothetical protein
MAHSNVKLNSCGDKAFPYFIPFWIGKLSDKYIPVCTLLPVPYHPD